MERKPYYVLRTYNSKCKLYEGITREINPHGGNGVQLYLTDEEVQKYNAEAIMEILRPYVEITMKRYMLIPPELIFYAICEVLFGNENTVN